MPHSSGGGSSHGGSHRSGHGGSGGPSFVKMSRHPFHGSHVFVRYYGGHPHYMYSASKDLQANNDQLIGIMIFLTIFVLYGLTMVASSYHVPRKLSDSGVVRRDVEIIDAAYVLGDTTELYATIRDFYNTTGVVPVVVTMHNDEWQGSGYDLEQYAYNWYVANFRDEKHWVIMYSEDPYAWSTDRFGDWHWEGMQGDDTDDIITTGVANQFTDRFHANLLFEDMSVNEALIDAFKQIMPDIMTPSFDDDVEGNLGVVTLGSVALFIVVCVFVVNKIRYKKYERIDKAVIRNNIPVEDTCAYCGGIYVVGTVLKCPHCDAVIPAHNPYNQSVAR